jgi:hypothetical protein
MLALDQLLQTLQRQRVCDDSEVLFVATRGQVDEVQETRSSMS